MEPLKRLYVNPNDDPLQADQKDEWHSAAPYVAVSRRPSKGSNFAA
jgi:endo-beta-N-acetylglucosaminidase D